MPEDSFATFDSHRLKQFGVLASVLVVGISLPVLFGLNQSEPFQAWQIMPFNTALAIGMLGFAILAATLERSTASAVLATSVALISGITLVEHLTHLDLGIDQLFAAANSSALLDFPGRMSLLSSTALLLLSLSVMLHLRNDGRLQSLAGFFAGIAAAVGLLSPLASRFSAQFNLAAATKMSKPSGVVFLVAGSYVLFFSLSD